ncbi:type II secretion system minor pseudopilin GspH [Oceanicoccus sagamiensis]|uniref:Type II secretion system protein H n=1 Tax=Oceanicoccus sagamiensis TaxID=716816 RepID=A0A1X9NDF6_9GAMM|nr:type II secretion system minor pseudopilin GspH [Oceanicoccus sagamiensis]ARN75596.1 type II secretion system protein GspH [Oceanicoccus sagamiensis]
MTAKQQGFTLIEIMLVLVVIGVMASMLAVSLGDNAQKQLDREARRLQVSLQMVADEAVMQGGEFALAIGRDASKDSNGYQFLLLDPERLVWSALNDKLFAFHPLSSAISIDVALAGGDDPQFSRQLERLQSLDNQQGPEPLLLLLSSGEITPFVITLNHQELSEPVRLASDGISGVELR